MWEGSYLAEPFDLRLTLLRLLRNLGWIVLFTCVGTVLFGGLYYVKNVLWGEPVRYEKTIVCKMEYTNPPVQSGDYYINDMTWNTYLDSDLFGKMMEDSGVRKDKIADAEDLDEWTGCETGLSGALSAAVASDIHVPSFTVSTLSEEKTQILCEALQEVLTGVFVQNIPEVKSIYVMQEGEVTAVRPDVRPVRAVLLSAVLSGFFVLLYFLFRELLSDSIFLPATLRRRYGLRTVGTIDSPELLENLKYTLAQQQSIAVCATDGQTDVKEVIEVLQERITAAAWPGQGSRLLKDWIAVVTPVWDGENMVYLHGADGVLLVVKAGLHAGKPLERLLEFFAVQDVQVSAAILWDADEWLIRSYYLLPDGRR